MSSESNWTEVKRKKKRSEAEMSEITSFTSQKPHERPSFQAHQEINKIFQECNTLKKKVESLPEVSISNKKEMVLEAARKALTYYIALENRSGHTTLAAETVETVDFLLEEMHNPYPVFSRATENSSRFAVFNIQQEISKIQKNLDQITEQIAIQTSDFTNQIEIQTTDISDQIEFQSTELVEQITNQTTELTSQIDRSINNQIDQSNELGKSIKNRTIELSNQIQKQSKKSPTYAEITKSATDRIDSSDKIDSTTTTTTTTTNKIEPSTTANSESLTNRRLILKTSKETLEKLDSMSVRDQINQQFYLQKKIDKPVIQQVVRSRNNLSIVLTTMENFSAQFLIENQKIWQNSIPFKTIEKDEKWQQLVIHQVPNKFFSSDDGLHLLKSEIETFNPIKLTRNPIWLSKEENRIKKVFSSILISVKNQNEAQKILDNKISIAGISCKVEKYIQKETDKPCLKCKKTGHITANCISKRSRANSAMSIEKIES
jgi:hypothetical protein